jgi:hypothetical protein
VLQSGRGHFTGYADALCRSLGKQRAGSTYQASQFPLALRVTSPDGGWLGTQWKGNLFGTDEQERRQHLTCGSNPKVCAPPFYGWVAIGRPPATPDAGPRALILIQSSFSPTASVTTTAARICRPRAVECDSPSAVALAGFHGVQVDGQTNGSGRHGMIPFAPPSTYAGKAFGDGSPDLIEIDGAHPFRVSVLDVRGRTVVVFVGTLVLSRDEFAAFLPRADGVLATLRFPTGGRAVSQAMPRRRSLPERRRTTAITSATATKNSSGIIWPTSTAA